MSQNIEIKKRTILESLNGHLQLQAVRLKNIDLETNILPANTSLLKKNVNNVTNKKVSSGVDMRKTFNATPSIKTPVSFTKNKLNKQKMRALKPYDPLYTWNRGGRLKELRIRCQARKYFYIWRNKSIGQITDLRARSHYRTRLIRTAWNIWYQQYWQLRIEPRLFGRAILYRKSVILRLVITSWRNWSQLQMQKRDKAALAVKFCMDNVKRSTFNIWLSWIFVKKCKIKLNIIAEKQSNKKLLEATFNVWKIAFQLKLEFTSQMATAKSHHDGFIKKKYMLKWISERPVLRHSKLIHEKAITHAKLNLLRIMWERWTNFHHKYKLKVKEKERLNNHYHWNLAHRFLVIWKQQYRTCLIQSALEAKCKHLSTKFQLRKYLAEWRQYHQYQKIRQNNMHKAREMANKLIKKHAWNQLKLYISRRKNQKIIKERVQLISNRLVRQQYFDKWVSRLEQKDDEKIRVEIGAARSHYRRSLFKKCFHKWSQYITICAAINEQEKLADSVYENNLMRRAIECWLKYVNISKYMKKLQVSKDNFVRTNVLIKYWNLWKHETDRRSCLEIQLNKYIENRKFHQKQVIFQKWFSLTSLKIKENSKNNQAAEHYKNKVLSKHFSAIFKYVQSQHLKKINIDLAHMHLQHKMKEKIFSAWHAVCIKKQHQTNMLMSRYQKVEYDIKSIVFDRWIKYVNNKRLIKFKVNELFKEKKRKVLSQTFKAWLQGTIKRKSKKAASLRKTLDGKCKLEESYKKTLFVFWKNQTLAILEESKKTKKADALFRRRCLTYYLEGWKQYHHERIMKYQQQQQSCWFWEKSEQIRVWFIWRRALADRQRENYYTRFALCHWSINLQKKVFYLWYQYIIKRRERILKENEAFIEYQGRLKKYTIRQWLKSADFLIQWRSGQCKSAGDSSLTSSAVVKAVEQWKRFTQLRSGNSLTSKPNLPKFPFEIKQFHVKACHDGNYPKKKTRPKPKIPEFLSGCHKDKQMTHLDKESHVLSIQSDLSDDVLLPPTSFERDSQQNGPPITALPSQSNKDLLEEINHIKEQLQHFKECKAVCRNLEIELSEYETALTQLGDNPANDSSFYTEFDPFVYRDKLAQSVADLRSDLSQQKDVCFNLSKRLQEIMVMSVNK